MAEVETPRYLCPRCKLGWKTTVMEQSVGSWTLKQHLICPECGLTDYPGEVAHHSYGRPVKVEAKHNVPKNTLVATPPKMVCQNCGVGIYKTSSDVSYRHTDGRRECRKRRKR